MYHQKLSPQAAVDRCAAMMHESYERFYKKEEELYKEIDAEHLDNVKAYVQVFKDMVMSVHHWQ